MSDVIRLLPDSVANQIAAGEVIQRPASVVKELIENAVDAGADTITLIVKDAGRTLIQVVDNGCGMSDTDARLAFERHSTSKIADAADLFALRTMGFRGEALASIAAVAQVELRTMPHGASIGTCLKLSGSRVESQQPCATAPGSNMMVKNLFFNVPARRKFLKKDAVELNNILREFERLALVNPDRELSIIHNDNTLHQLTKGTLRQRIGALFGKSLEKQLVPIATETSIVKISGFVGLPENARRRGALQYFFVNGRNMRHPYFHKAVLNCYEQLIRADHQPNYFINFDVDPATIDVNIHPTKNEIKFENEQSVWQILSAAIRESLGRFNVAPAIDFNSESTADLPGFQPNANALDGMAMHTDYNPFAPAADAPRTGRTVASASNRGGDAQWRRESAQSINDWDKLYASFTSERGKAPAGGSDTYNPFTSSPTDSPSTPGIPSRMNSDDGSSIADDATPTVIQLKQKYIVTPGRNGLLLIDQYRAHMLVLYNRLMALEAQATSMPTQQVMFAETLTLTPDRNVMLLEVRDELVKAGYQLTPVGENAWSIEGVPAIEVHQSHESLLRDMLDDLAEGTDITSQSVRHHIALRLARAGAITAGHHLSAQEMEHLLSELMSQPSPNYTPDGNRIIAELSVDDIESLL